MLQFHPKSRIIEVPRGELTKRHLSTSIYNEFDKWLLAIYWVNTWQSISMTMVEHFPQHFLLALLSEMWPMISQVFSDLPYL
jgi:hypothetical protein